MVSDPSPEDISTSGAGAPRLNSATLCSSPAATDITLLGPAATGRLLLRIVPFPSRPNSFEPHENSLPALTARLNRQPAETDVTLPSASTRAGTRSEERRVGKEGRDWGSRYQ